MIVDVPHHVTQRGNARQVILASDAEHVTYLELLREYSQLYALSLLGYCLMSNHVHLIAIPQTAQALGQSLKQAHGRYAAYWNAQQSSTGENLENLDKPGDRRDVHRFFATDMGIRSPITSPKCRMLRHGSSLSDIFCAWLDCRVSSLLTFPIMLRSAAMPGK